MNSTLVQGCPVDTAKIGSFQVASLCYIPEWCSTLSFLKHLASRKHLFPIYLVAEEQIFLAVPNSAPFGVLPPIPQIGPFTDSSRRPLVDQYAFWAFVGLIRSARDLDLDYFICLEPDCRFSTDFWDRELVAEFQNWPYPNPVAGGTPVCWFPWSQKQIFSQKVIDYAYRYQQVSGIAMALEGGYSGQFGQSIYPNGALGIYSVPEMTEAFGEQLRFFQNHSISSREYQQAIVEKLWAYDLRVGHFLLHKYGGGIFEKLAFIPSIYSGYGNRHVTLEERIQMYDYKTKVAIHQLKEKDFNFSED